MSKFTTKQRQWLYKLQDFLDNCPFDCNGIEAYTIGDTNLTIFNKANKILEYQEVNLCGVSEAIEVVKSDTIMINFPFTIHAVRD